MSEPAPYERHLALRLILFLPQYNLLLKNPAYNLLPTLFIYQLMEVLTASLLLTQIFLVRKEDTLHMLIQEDQDLVVCELQ